MGDINFKNIEKKWQSKWQEKKIFEAHEDSSKPKYYCLEMFPYPSGSGLHIGHAWNYLLGDILARFKLMGGFNVLHPMGYDSLGLPAENAAIKDKVHPEEYTLKSMENFGIQQKELGFAYDWSRTLVTSDPSYYIWDQWMFLKMFERGLAYQKNAAVNWCSSCETVLANEQSQGGKCDRCSTPVHIKRLKQWFFKITDYADELYERIDVLHWPEKTKTMQKNWIGKSHGTQIDFEVNGKKWPVFTTRPDTLFGVTFMVISAQHEKLDELVIPEQRLSIDEFLKKIHNVSQKTMKEVENLDKEGVFTGSYAINPANGQKIPIWAGNFVIADYGTGLVMGVPSHDKRDFEFAKRYSIEIKSVIEPLGEDFNIIIDNSNISDIANILKEKSHYSEQVSLTEKSYSLKKEFKKLIKDKISQENLKEHHGFILENDNSIKIVGAYIGEGVLINSGEFNGMNNRVAIEKITAWLEEKGLGKKTINYKLRDWGISRQRYWGTPIPIIHCGNCGAVAVPEKDLPVVLPKEVTFGKGNPLLTNQEWLNTACPKCNGAAKRESDTMDTFVNSSWYFLRYCDPSNTERIFDKEKIKYWCPIDTYIGGAEHACMHLIYCRFYTKFLRDMGLLKFDEPANTVFHQGTIHGSDGNKMSKSLGNVVDPMKTAEKFGVDPLRFFLVSVASPDKNFNWSEKGIIGSLRFIKSIFSFDYEFKPEKDSKKVLESLNKTILDVEEYYETFEYRKATIQIRQFFEMIEKEGCSKSTYGKFLKILSPICPHITEELWEKLGNKNFICLSEWPKAKKEKNKGKEYDINQRILEQIDFVIKKTKTIYDNIYVYVMPFEINQVNEAFISSNLGKSIEISSVDDEEKYDPAKKAKKAKPGLPSIYLE